jgi:hypothetical protein
MCMGHRCIMSSRRKRRNEVKAMAVQNARVIISWQKKLILGVALPRRAYVSSMNSTEVVNGHRYSLSTISAFHSLLCLCFFSIISYPPARIREVPVQCSTTFFFLFLSFLRIVVKQVIPSLVPVIFPTQSPESPLSIYLSRSLSCWPLAYPESHSPIPFFYHHHGRSLRSSV